MISEKNSSMIFKILQITKNSHSLALYIIINLFKTSVIAVFALCTTCTTLNHS